jgi:hypothetical protein
MDEQELEKPQRQKVAAATLAEILINEISVSMGGRDASYLKPRIAFAAVNGEPNWAAKIGEVPLNTLSAYNEALGRVRERYELDNDSHSRLQSI